MKSLRRQILLTLSRFRPKRKPRYFGSVPIIRCLSSKRGLKCFRRNTIDKRWYSLSPARTCGSLYSEAPRGRKRRMDVRGQRAQFSLQRSRIGNKSASWGECPGPEMAGMKIPSEYESHILDHMRCNCSACMNFACQWRRALKTEFRRRVKDPFTLKRKPKRWMPVQVRHSAPERVQICGRSKTQSAGRKSPQVSWWFGNYNPSSDSEDDFFKSESVDAEPNGSGPRRHSQEPIVQTSADGFDDVAMDGTTEPSRLTYRARKLSRSHSLDRDRTARCSSGVAPSFNGPQCKARNPLAQGVLNGEGTPEGSAEMEIQNNHGAAARKMRSHFNSLSGGYWDVENSCKSKNERQHSFDNKYWNSGITEGDRSRFLQARNELKSDNSTNRYFRQGSRPHNGRSKFQSGVYDDKSSYSHDSICGSRNIFKSSEHVERPFEMGRYHYNNGYDSGDGFSYSDFNALKCAQNNHSSALRRYQQQHRIYTEKSVLDPVHRHDISFEASERPANVYRPERSTSINVRHNQIHRINRNHLDQLYSSHHHHHHHDDYSQHQIHNSTLAHGDSASNDSLQTTQYVDSTEHPTGMSTRSPKRDSDHAKYRRINRLYTDLHLDKNICNRLNKENFLETGKENLRKDTPCVLEKSQKCPKPGTKTSNSSDILSKCRSPNKICRRWTTLSPSKVDLCPSTRETSNYKEYNDNNRRSTGSPDSAGSDRDHRTLHTTRNDKRCSQRSPISPKRHSFLNVDRPFLSSRHSRERDKSRGNTNKRQQTTSPSPLDSNRSKTTGSTRRSRSRSRRDEDSTSKLTRRVLDATQSNATRSSDSPIKYRHDTQTFPFWPSQRVMSEARPRSRPEWLNKHLSLMTECSQEQQNNAKSRMTRIVDKTNNLARSTEHMHLDFSGLHERLDRVKDLQRRYFDRAEEAVRKIKDRNRTFAHSQAAKNCTKNAKENEQKCSILYLQDTSDGSSTHRHRGKRFNSREAETKETDSRNEPRRSSTRRESGIIDYLGHDRTRLSGVDSHLGVADTSSIETVSDSCSEPDNETDDGEGSWFIDGKHRLISRKIVAAK